MIAEYGLPLEVDLSTQIYNALQGNIVEEIIKLAKNIMLGDICLEDVMMKSIKEKSQLIKM